MAELSVDTVMLIAKDLLGGCHSFVTITWGVVHIEDYLTLIICASSLPPPPKSIRQCQGTFSWKEIPAPMGKVNISSTGVVVVSRRREKPLGDRVVMKILPMLIFIVS